MNTTCIESNNKLMTNSKFRKISYANNDFSLLIRPLEEGDADIIQAAVLLSKDNLKPFMDWVHCNINIEQQQERIRASIALFSQGTTYDFAVLDVKSNEFVMSASLRASRIPNKKSLEIGYWTSSKYCNQGLATIVTKILIIIAFETFGCDRVEIGCNKANQKSMRVIEKCGFKLESEVRNYFSEPTSEMVQNGLNPSRTGLLFALIKDDIRNLSWYNEIANDLVR